VPLAYKEFDFKNGDVVYMRVASGGGYGDPLERNPQLVLEDIVDGIISLKAGREIYGVVLDETGQAVDLTATKSLRAALQKNSDLSNVRSE
jgi:N-methylhydantoinase B/oxoprolinase/acetone carboxylase alpha subunit